MMLIIKLNYKLRNFRPIEVITKKFMTSYKKMQLLKSMIYGKTNKVLLFRVTLLSLHQVFTTKVSPVSLGTCCLKIIVFAILDRHHVVWRSPDPTLAIWTNFLRERIHFPPFFSVSF